MVNLPPSLEVEAHAFACAVNPTIAAAIELIEGDAVSTVVELVVPAVGRVRVIGVKCPCANGRHVVVQTEIAAWQWHEEEKRLVRIGS